LGATPQQVKMALETFRENETVTDQPWDWGVGLKRALAEQLRRAMFPIHVAANKAEIAPGESWKTLQSRLAEEGAILMPTMADAELGLRRAASMGFIEYGPGEVDFEFTEQGRQRLKPVQIEALDKMKETMGGFGGTGVSILISRVLHESLSHIVAYPVQDETHWTDGDGRILPDALVVADDSTVKELAYAVHSDLGDGFIKAIDGKSKRVIGAEHELSDGDVIKIHAKT